MEVFLSVGRIATEEQRHFLEKVETKLRNRGFEPRTIGRNTFASDKPLERIIEVMRECRGLLVLAFERTYLEAGHEWVSGESAPVEISGRRYSTPWHHIEIAFAKILDLPIFVIVEKGVCEEGLLEDKYGWYVLRTKLDPAVLDSEETVGLLDDWARRSRNAKAVITPGDFTIGALVSGLRPAQLWSVLTAFVAIVIGAFTFGLKWTQRAAPSSGPVQASVLSTISPPSDADVRQFLARGRYVTRDIHGRFLPWTFTNQPCDPLSGEQGGSACIPTPAIVSARNVVIGQQKEIAAFAARGECERYDSAVATGAQLSPCRSYNL